MKDLVRHDGGNVEEKSFVDKMVQLWEVQKTGAPQLILAITEVTEDKIVDAGGPWSRGKRVACDGWIRTISGGLNHPKDKSLATGVQVEKSRVTGPLSTEF